MNLLSSRLRLLNIEEEIEGKERKEMHWYQGEKCRRRQREGKKNKEAKEKKD